MYGYKCDGCGCMTTSEDDHVTTDSGEFLCVSCANKAGEISSDNEEQGGENGYRFTVTFTDAQGHEKIFEGLWALDEESAKNFVYDEYGSDIHIEGVFQA